MTQSEGSLFIIGVIALIVFTLVIAFGCLPEPDSPLECFPPPTECIDRTVSQRSYSCSCYHKLTGELFFYNQRE
jgi:hypothetical protein